MPVIEEQFVDLITQLTTSGRCAVVWVEGQRVALLEVVSSGDGVIVGVGANRTQTMIRLDRISAVQESEGFL